MLELFIKSMSLDEEDRIVIIVQDQIKSALQDEKSRKMVKETLEKTLGEDFIKLEMTKSSARVTTTEGKGAESLEKIKVELGNIMNMASEYMSQMDKEEN